MYEIEPNFIAIRPSNKKKIAKNRGIIMKNSSLEVNYLMDSLHFRRRLHLYVTFFKPLSHVQIRLHEKSIKFWKSNPISFKHYKRN